MSEQILNKKIKKILKDSSLSINKKTSLINELIVNHNKKLSLQANSQLPSGNKLLLSGGGKKTTPTDSSSTSEPSQKFDDFDDNDNDDNNDDDDEDDEDDDDDDDDDNEDEDDNNDDDQPKNSATIHDISKQLRNSLNIIKIIAKSNAIKLNSSNYLAFDKTAQIIKRYFSEPTTEGLESKDRRFLLKNNNIIVYQGDAKEIRLRLQKLLISFSLNNSKLFAFLEATSSKKIGVVPYSSDEKAFLGTFARLSHFNCKHIPCFKIRKLCL